jgi:hypothetical protein
MPFVYGKSLHSSALDIKESLSLIIKSNESLKIAKALIPFWMKMFPSIYNWMSFINEIGWLAASVNQPVIYRNRFMTTIQDYMVKKERYVWLYDRLKQKRRKMTLTLPTILPLGIKERA